MTLKNIFEILVNADLTNLFNLLFTVVVYGSLLVFAIVGLIIIFSALFVFVLNINSWINKKHTQKELAQKRENYRNYH